MRRFLSIVTRGAATLLLMSCWLTLAAASTIQPLINAHSHNDYEHTRPLLDALDHGFCSVESDIWLVDGKLLVGHSRSQLRPERTLEALYLAPLRERVKKNGGRVHAGGPECSLLIDLKTDWQTTYPALRAVLTNYADILTVFRDGKAVRGALLVVLSGNRSKEMFAGENPRFAAYDGELSETGSPAELVPWVSANWKSVFKWRGIGNLPAAEKARLQDIVKRAHGEGRRVRFWGAPDVPAFWSEMLKERVDLINTDDLDGLSRFLIENKTPSAQLDTKGSIPER
jgi:hypothetical protein